MPSSHYAEGPPNGPPLVLLHGTTRDSSSFSVLFPDLVPRFHIFALDLRGHGGSGRVKDGYSVLGMGEDVREFVGTLIPVPAAIFGSLGAMVGMYAAADHANVAALIVGDAMITPSHLSPIYDPIFSQLYQLLPVCHSVEELARGIGRIQVHLPGIGEVIQLDEIAGKLRRICLPGRALPYSPPGLPVNDRGRHRPCWLESRKDSASDKMPSVVAPSQSRARWFAERS
jgi:pimeloyl-ACP methyl ester carboxylesterase